MKQYFNPEQDKSKDLQSALDVVCTFISNYRYLIKEVKFSGNLDPQVFPVIVNGDSQVTEWIHKNGEFRL